MLRFILSLSFFFIAMIVVESVESKSAGPPQVVLETSLGNIVLELLPDKSPKTVENFVTYVKSGQYNGTIFHRVIPGFMIQGGGYDSTMKRKSTLAPIRNEADNGLKNVRGTIAMARTQDPHSASAQFFINTENNRFLNHTKKDLRGWGYAVFGRVVEGMDVVDAISKVKTGTRGGFKDVPLEPVIIQKATLKE